MSGISFGDKRNKPMCRLKKFNFEILFWVGIFVMLIFMLHGNILSADDEYCNFLKDGRIYMLRYYVYGTWVMPLQNLVLYYLPYKLSQYSFIPHINLQDWAQTVGVAFEASVLTVLMVYFSKFFKLFGLAKNIRLLCTTLFFMLFFAYMYRIQFIELILYTAFFRFVIPSVLMVIFIYYLYKLLINEKVNIYALCALAILAASSSEVIGIITITTCAFLSVYAFCTKQEYSKKIVILISFLLVGLLLLVHTPGFQDHFHLKYNEPQKNILFALAGYLVPFTKAYIKQLFIYNKELFIILSLLFFFPTNNEKYKAEKPLAVCLIASCLLFCYALIGLGNTLNDSNFWINHPDIYSIIYILFLTVFIILSRNLADFYNKTDKLKIISVFLVLLFLPSFCLQTKHLCSLISNIKDATYLRDKMVLYYLQTQEDVLLPYAVYRDNIYELQKNMGANFFDFYDACIFDYWSDFKDLSNFEFNIMLHNYYRYVYNFTNIPNNFYLMYTDGNSARTYFLNHGGSYSELISHKYHFSDLDIK